MNIKCERIFLFVTKKDFYSQLPITRTLANSNLALTRTKYRFPVDFFLCSTCTEVKLETIPVSLDSGPNCAYSLIRIYGSKGNVFSLNCTILFRIFPKANIMYWKERIGIYVGTKDKLISR